MTCWKNGKRKPGSNRSLSESKQLNPQQLEPMTTQDFLRALEQALGIESGKIAGTETLADSEWWDSMAALTFMALVDQELKVTISGAQLQKSKTVPDLLALVSDKL